MNVRYPKITLFTLIFTAFSFSQDLLITGVFDGPNIGGTPKGVELYVINNIPDLSIYSLGSANNGGGSDGEEFTFAADAVTAGSFIYVSVEESQFKVFFGFAPNYVDGSMGLNGDDAVELFKNGIVIDTFGDINKDGTGESWNYQDGWAYRLNTTKPDGTFVLNNWKFSGTNKLEGGTTNATTNIPFPLASYKAFISTEPGLFINSPLAVAYENRSSVITNITVTNFILSGNNGNNMGNNSGDGFIKRTLEVQGGAKEVTSFFSTILPAIVVEAGKTYTLTMELVDNNGDSLATPVISAVTFNINFPCDILLGDYVFSCNSITTGIDTYNIAIPFTMGKTSTYTLSSNFGTIQGDDPSVNETGTIHIVNIPEGTDIIFELKGDVTNSKCDFSRTITSPTCLPEPICPNVGSLIITEIMQNPSAVSDSNGEYFEVYNTSNTAIDLLGWSIATVTTGVPATSVIDKSVIVPANGYVVLGENNDMTTNGGVFVNYKYENKLFLGNNAATIVLSCGSKMMDEVSYDGGTTFPNPSGKSMELATDKYSAIDNNLGINWAEATVEITSGGDLGTPGAANSFVLNVTNNTILEFSTYPNPITNKELTIVTSNSNTKEIVIYNLLGKKVLATKFSEVKTTIDVSEVNNGIYILKVTEEGKTATKKLIIQ
ncbi:T9SS type A sorting domain-containing protein [uncultured Polaribacter sp.]|uniref:T9SS type A sorting domain-containing protein n=1 Tax=uncultured Polaribacter sp. TaxID=174711 RepID=UPI0026137243|nr:T9SS type A sorting domain-containing protein [uncultured Polaribacter sp.]